MEIKFVGKIDGLSHYDTGDYMLVIYENYIQYDDKIRVDYLDLVTKEKGQKMLPFIIKDRKIQFTEETKLIKNVRECLKVSGWGVTP